MKSKQQTPLGYLMALLEVSLADLGDYLYVAQTSISKWKTGARILKPTSQHFGGIVEYFVMLSRDPDRREKLRQLFTRLYPEQPLDGAEQMEACLRAFLSGKVLPSMTVPQVLAEEGRLYTAEVAVFGGDAGSASAVSHLLGFLAEKEPDTLCVAVGRSDPPVLERLLPALQNGWRMRLLLPTPAPALLLTGLASILAHPRVELKCMPPGAPCALGDACCIAGGELMLVQYAPQGRPSYAALYTDALTIEHARLRFDGVWNGLEPVFAAAAREKLTAEFFARAMENTVDEGIDWLSPSLPYVTMSRELLMEVLKAGGVSGRVWSRVLGGYDVLAGQRYRLLIPAKALRGDTRGCPMLSMLCGAEITLSPAQVKRHLLDTAALLRADRGAAIVPIQGERRPIWQFVSPFVRRNAFAGSLNFEEAYVRWTRQPRLTEAYMAAMDALAEGETAGIRNPSHVAGLLERTALESK